MGTCHLKIKRKKKKSSYITNFLEFFLISVVLWTLQEVQYAYFNLTVVPNTASYSDILIPA